MKRIVCALLCALLLILCLSGCVSLNFDPWAVPGKGEAERYDIPVGAFTGISVSIYCEIQYHAAPAAAVSLEVQPNLREYIHIAEENGVLNVTSKQKRIVSSVKAPVLTVYAPTLTRLDVEGACMFKTNDAIAADRFVLNLAGAGQATAELDVGELAVNLAGAGELKLSGTADTASLTMAGAGEINALALQARDAEVCLDGLGSVSVACSDNLEIQADGAGSIRYKGSPSLDISKSGLVSIEQVD